MSPREAESLSEGCRVRSKDTSKVYVVRSVIKTGEKRFTVHAEDDTGYPVWIPHTRLTHCEPEIRVKYEQE